jgi:phosphotransferase system enzyme I (PtsP)
MVMAEIVASGELPNVAAVIEDDIAHIRSHRLTGNALSEGLALGHVVLHQPRVVVENLIAEDMEAEHKRLDEAISNLRKDIDQMFNPADTHRGGEYRDVLEAYRMFAHDEGWVSHMQEAIDTGITAEAAVERVQNNNRARMMRSEDPYLRERLHDFDDLAHRLLRTLSGEVATAAKGKLPKDAIIVARNMGPAELLDYDRKHLRGVVLEEGSVHSHVTIVARALGVPMVGTASGILDMVDPDEPVIVDGNSGEVYVRPSSDVEEIYADKARLGARKQEQYAKLKDEPSITRDGVSVKLLINVGLKVDLPQLTASGADGVGLFRTELQFMIASKFPRMDEQMAHYSSVLESAGEKPVVFRSLDIGSDKFLPYLKHDREENPALGWRALRMSLDRPALIRLQLRALLRAANGREIRVMFPMVSTVDEFKRAKDALDHELDLLEKRGSNPPSKLHVGAMLEVPALLYQLDNLLPLVDFISVGSNDLFQFLFACDRANQRVSERYDVLSPAFLRTLRDIVEKCDGADVPLNLCGEMAGNPIEAMALIAIGFRSISMSPASIGPVKDMIRKIDLSDLEQFLLPLLETSQPSLRAEIEALARDKKILMNS